jgi:hypothetical protein
MNTLKEILKFKTLNFNIQESQQLQESVQRIEKHITKNFSNPSFNMFREEAEQIDEGILTGLLGGLVGATAGAAIMRAVCNVLKISNGPLYDLLTSKLVCGAVGVVLGK